MDWTALSVNGKTENGAVLFYMRDIDYQNTGLMENHDKF